MRRRHKLGGFILPMVIVLVFAIMAVTSALIGTVTTISRMARAKSFALVETISLESAATWIASDLAEGGAAPMTSAAGPQQYFNGYQINTVLAAPEGKLDVNEDAPQAVTSELAAMGLPPALVTRLAALRPVSTGLPAPLPVSLGELTARGQLGTAEEDCLRRLATAGRWPAERMQAAQTPAAVNQRVLNPAQQIDLRASLAGRDGREHLLWTRLRLTGNAQRPVLAQDWRLFALVPSSGTTSSGCSARLIAGNQ